MEIGFSTLDLRRIEDLKETDFERFCEELVRFEARERHRDAQVSGPLKPGVADGGKDIHLKVKSAPRRSREEFGEALTEDDPVETFFSCKGGEKWQESVKKDAAKRGGMARVLARGGRLTVLVNRPVDIEKLTATPVKITGRKARKSFVQAVAETAAKAMAGLRKKLPSVDEIIGRITIYDANALAAFLRGHRPSLSAEFKRALGIIEPPAIVSLDRWRALLHHDRGLPSFELDPDRERLVVQVLNMLRGDGPRAIWLHGPPGIGKTRLVLEALLMAKSQHGRVCVASREPIGADALERYDLVAKMPEVALVIDECPASRVHALYSMFSAALDAQSAPTARACLILIGPPGEARVSESVREVALGPLGDLALRRMIESELLDAPVESVNTILRLSEGYPWYAVLLARELRRTDVRPPREPDARFAAMAAIAPLRDDQDAWERTVYARARALLAVILTERRPWRALDETARSALCAAVRLTSWSELTDRVRECVTRGLIRQSEDTEFRYVTPAVLVREVVAMLLKPPDGSGPDLRRHTPHLADGLYERLAELGVSPDLQRELALQDLAVWRHEARTPSQLALRVSARALLFAARLCPKETAEHLGAMFAQPFSEEVAARFGTVALPCLGHLISRRGCFALAEAALFTLTVTERGEPMRPATELWSKALVPAWGESYTSVRERAAILTRRATSGSAPERLASLAAFEHLASTERWWSVHEPHDGPWLPLDPAEVRREMASLWRLLAVMTLDVDPAVASRARGIVTRRLRNAVRAGFATDGAIELSARASLWNDSERSDLRDALDRIEAYDHAFVTDVAGLDEHLQVLRRAVTSRTWRDRLLDRVAHWLPSARGSDHENEDLPVAREGVTGDVPLTRELEWLDSSEARRAHDFMGCVGEVDTDRAMLPHLVARVGEGRARNAMILPKYLQGVASAGGRAEVDALLRSWRRDPVFARTVVLAVWLLGANEENIGWIVDDLRGAGLFTKDLSVLEAGSWDRGVPWVSVEPLVCALVANRTDATLQLALTFVNNRLRWQPSLARELAPLLARILTTSTLGAALAGSLFAHEWEVGVGHLIDLQMRDEALAVAAAALDRGHTSPLFEQSWTALLRLARDEPTAVWRRVSQRFDQTEDREVRWDWHWRSLGMLVSTELLLDWVEDDPWRARVAASFANVRTVPLSPLARALLLRFGPDGDVAATLLVNALNPPLDAGSHASFMREQLDRAGAWLEDDAPEIITWARRCAAELRVRAEDTERASVG